MPAKGVWKVTPRARTQCPLLRLSTGCQEVLQEVQCLGELPLDVKGPGPKKRLDLILSEGESSLVPHVTLSGIHPAEPWGHRDITLLLKGVGL